jgi:hypothetical protein
MTLTQALIKWINGWERELKLALGFHLLGWATFIGFGILTELIFKVDTFWVFEAASVVLTIVGAVVAVISGIIIVMILGED